MEVAGAAVPPNVIATIRLRGGRTSGKAGCNTCGTGYHVAANGSVSFSQTIFTKMACLTPEGAMQVERRVLAALPHIAKVEIQGVGLVLLGAEGDPLAKLKPASRA